MDAQSNRGEELQTRAAIPTEILNGALSRFLRTAFGRRPLSQEDVAARIGEIRACRKGLARLARARPRDDRGSAPTPDRQAASRLERRMDRARDDLVLGHLWLVLLVARRYQSPRVALSDRLQAGVCGLIEGIERFDPARGFRLSTYASWWVRRAVHGAMQEHGESVRVPTYRRAKLASFARTRSDLAAHFGRPPTPAEMSDVTGLSGARLDALRQGPPRMVELDRPVVDGNGGHELRRELADPGASPLDGLLSSSVADRLRSAVDDLEPRLRAVIRLRFGLAGDGRCATLREVAEFMDLSRERVRQLEAAALRRLRRSLTAPPSTRGG